MKKNFSFIILLLLLFSWPASLQAQTLNLMPYPSSLEKKEGKFLLDSSFTIAVFADSNSRVFSYAGRMLRRLDNRTILFFSQNLISPKANNENASLIIRCKRKGVLQLNENESYSLNISPTKIELYSETDLGALRGLETLLQLLSANKEGYYFPALSINDQPRFAWRGLLLDAGRHFYSLDQIKRTLDGLAMAKMNVFHWHLSEDQGFRVECKTFPKLHQLGSDGLYYTHAQVKEIIKYADERGIRVVPEFDIPGHTTSWFVGYPELASAPGPYTIERKFGVHDPTMDPTKESTYKFLDAFLKEMTALFPDQYFHIGGDENNGKQWKANPRIQAFMKANKIENEHALQAYFNKRILAILTKYGKKMMGWDEIFQPGLPKDIMIQSWRGKDSLYKTAKKGYPSILSHGYYIDLIQPTDFHYLNDPIPADAALSPEEQKNILGGEATMWSEYVNEETVDSRIWPRTAAIAERLWSPQNVNNVAFMYERLDKISLQLEELGLKHIKNSDMILRRLAQTDSIAALKNLVNVVEQVKRYSRGGKRPYTSYSPLSEIADAAPPDAKVAREFRNRVDEYLLNPNENLKKEITSWLVLWKNNHEDFITLINRAPVLKEAEPLSKYLSEISAIGLEALEGKSNDKIWVENSMKTIALAKKSYALCDLMVVSAIEKLVKGKK